MKTRRLALWMMVLALAGWAGIVRTAPLPSRQVHLDFHTSEDIPEVGAKFSKTQWQMALKLGRVNWINIFAKCHHGWSYYPTKVGKTHPTLKFDLMGKQIEACHEIGVRCPLYYTVGWSASEAEAHPDWRVRNKDGSYAARSVDFNASPEDRRPGTSWIFLCPSGEYRRQMLAQIEEICRLYPVDGFFFDINNVSPPCYCQHCRDGMAAEKVDVENEQAVADYNGRKWKRFFADLRQVIGKHHPQATVFFNGTTKLLPHCLNYDMAADNTQQELEDLPTTWGGYDKLPLRAKFFHRTGKPIIAMSGKFHTSWGEFGGFKHPDALRFEAASMIAFGASCNFGDQLHPSGEMDLETYKNIGHAYAYVEQIEEYGVGGQPVSRLGLWRTSSPPDDEGVSVMLMETQNDYVAVQPEEDLSRYETIIMTGAPGLTPAHAARLNAYVKNGGKLLVIGESALDRDRKQFLLDVGGHYVGPARFDEDYLLVGPKAGKEMVTTPFLTYKAAIQVQPDTGAEVLATIREPYFNRTYGHYCSHLNTPYQLTNAPHVGGLQKGNVILLPHRWGEIYATNGARLHRQFVINALDRLYEQPMVKAALPSAGRLSVLHQPEHRRYVSHLLYGPPLQRGRCLVIEDLPILRQVPVEARLPEKIKRAYLAPSRKSLSIKKSGNALRVVVPEFQGHTAVVWEY